MVALSTSHISLRMPLVQAHISTVYFAIVSESICPFSSCLFRRLPFPLILTIFLPTFSQSSLSPELHLVTDFKLGIHFYGYFAIPFRSTSYMQIFKKTSTVLFPKDCSTGNLYCPPCIFLLSLSERPLPVLSSSSFHLLSINNQYSISPSQRVHNLLPLDLYSIPGLCSNMDCTLLIKHFTGNILTLFFNRRNVFQHYMELQYNFNKKGDLKLFESKTKFLNKE